MWCIPRLDDAYIQRMEDLLELYERPYNPREPVICLDERPAVLRGDKRVRKPAKPGRCALYDYEYQRRGTANIFCAVEPLAGRHFTRVTRNRKAREFAKIMASLARRYPKARTIHIVMDNLSTHTMKSLRVQYGETMAKKIWSRFTVHFTPVHASWLNMAEIEIGLLNRQCIGTRRFPEISILRDEVNAWNARTNRARTRIEWVYCRDKARADFGYKPTSLKRPEY